MAEESEIKEDSTQQNDPAIVAWLAMSPEQQRKSLAEAKDRAERKERMLANMQERRMTKKYSIKKIVSEPKLLGDWLMEQYDYLSEVSSERPIFAQMQKEIGSATLAIGTTAPEEVHRLLEGKARRMARKHGYFLRKGKEPYTSTNLGLFRVVDSNGATYAGHNHHLSAQDVIVLFRNLNKSKQKARINQPREGIMHRRANKEMRTH